MKSGPIVALLAWVGFFGAFGLTLWIDYAMRMAEGDVHQGGFARSTFFALHTLYAVLACSGLLYAARRATWPLALLGIVAQLAIAIPLYLAACLAYGIGTGIDSF